MQGSSKIRILFFGDPAVLGEKFDSLKAGWDVAIAASPADVLRQLRTADAPDLVLLAPGTSLDETLELCRAIKFDRRTSFVPVVAVRTAEHELRVHDVLAAGVDEYVPAWVSQREIHLRLDKCARLKRITDSLEDAETVITALASAIEGKDECTCGHVERVSMYCLEIGKSVGVNADGLAALRIGGVVHDIGKVSIPDPILNKPGKLTDEEMAIMRRHPVIGYDILKPLRTFKNVLPIVRWHHERPNGTGYPDGLQGEEIPLLARITAVADVFDALSTDRPYRKAMPLDKCRDILAAEASRGNLDPRIVATLFQVLNIHPPTPQPT